MAERLMMRIVRSCDLRAMRSQAKIIEAERRVKNVRPHVGQHDRLKQLRPHADKWAREVLLVSAAAFGILCRSAPSAVGASGLKQRRSETSQLRPSGDAETRMMPNVECASGCEVADSHDHIHDMSARDNHSGCCPLARISFEDSAALRLRLAPSIHHVGKIKNLRRRDLRYC